MKNFDSKITELQDQKLILLEGPKYTGLNRDLKKLNLKLKNLFKSRKYYLQSQEMAF